MRLLSLTLPWKSCPSGEYMSVQRYFTIVVGTSTKMHSCRWCGRVMKTLDLRLKLQSAFCFCFFKLCLILKEIPGKAIFQALSVEME